MKTRHWLFAVALAALQAPALASPPEEAATPPPAAAAGDAAAPAAPGANGFWNFSYAMGYSFGSRLKVEIPETDAGAFFAGLQAAFDGKTPHITGDEMRAASEDYNAYREAKAQAEADKIAADNLAKAETFLAGNGKRKGVKTTKSGLQYEVLRKGKGPAPAATDIVTAHYHGTLPDGTVFDSSLEAQPVDFPLNRVIPGWTEGLQLMNKGAKFRFAIPPALAYGARGIEDAIGPNQVLLFEVELVDFKPAPPPSTGVDPNLEDAEPAAEAPATP